MIKYYANNVDITSSVQRETLSLTEQANNRRNTAKFTVIGTAISEATLIDIWKLTKSSAALSAGVSSFVVDDIFKNNDFFRAGDRIVLGLKTANEEYVTIQSVTKATSTILLTSTTRYTHAKGDLIGKKLFSGMTLKNPREEIGKSDVLTYSVDCSDNSSIYDTHNVVDTYVSMYAREILGRIVYKYTANDSQNDISDLETTGALTASGVAVTPVLDSTDKIYKNNSLQIGSSAAGNAIYTNTFSAIDCSVYDRMRFWLKMPSLPSNWVSGITVKLISSAGNYFQWTDAVQYDSVWSYDSFDFSRATIVGTPVRTAITSFELTLVATKTIPVGTFKIDHIYLSKGGFTLRGTQRGNILFKDVRAQYKKPTVLTEALSKNDGYIWFVDNDRDLRYFDAETRFSPFNVVAPSGLYYGQLKITADITNLKNRVVVRGGIAPSDFLYTQKHVCDGKETSYRLDYPPKGLVVYTSTDGGVTWSAPRTVGVENLVSDTSVEFLFNFSEKTVRNGSISALTAGVVIRFDYYPYKEVRVSAQDDISIARMKGLLGGDGIFDGAVINDASFRTFDEARARAKAEIAAYSNPVLTATFVTESDGLEV